MDCEENSLFKVDKLTNDHKGKRHMLNKYCFKIYGVDKI